jgi:hypothetical protein
MVTSKWCCKNINSGNIMFKNIISEVKELFEARNLEDVKEEFGDVLYFSYCWLYCKFGINLPMIGAMSSVGKFTIRLDFWEFIFKVNGFEFDPKYLINGSNYLKPEKINAALDMARRDQEGWG